MELVSNLITNFGFPIFCCLVMGKYIMEKDKKSTEKFDFIMKEYVDLIEKTTSALENNTHAMEELKEIIKEREVKENDS